MFYTLHSDQLEEREVLSLVLLNRFSWRQRIDSDRRGARLPAARAQ
jgi:hypothetical protein